MFMRGRYTYPISYILIVFKYLEWRRRRYGNRSACFTYRGILNWIRFQKELSDLEPTTLERNIRRLAEEGYLIRVRERPTALFCASKHFFDYLKRKFPDLADWELWE